MAQIRGTAGYNLGGQDRFGGAGRADATNDPSPLEQIREQTSKIEEWLDNAADPIKPCVYSHKTMELDDDGIRGGSHAAKACKVPKRRLVNGIDRFYERLTNIANE